MKDTLSTINLQLSASQFICEKLQESLVRTAQYYVTLNKNNLDSHMLVMRGYLSGDTQSEVVRAGIDATHRKIQYTQENLSDWGQVLLKLKAVQVSDDAVQESSLSIDDIISQYN